MFRREQRLKKYRISGFKVMIDLRVSQESRAGEKRTLGDNCRLIVF